MVEIAQFVVHPGEGSPIGVVHQLIQRATRDALTSHQHHATARTCADALMEAWPEVERDTDLAQALRANTTALTACAQDALYRPDAHEVLYHAGQSLGETGQVTAARNYFSDLAATARHHLGPDHSDTLIARNNLARWRGGAGDAGGAAAAFADLLADRVRVLGPDHRDTLTTRGNLAWWLWETGYAREAADITAGLLVDRARVLGERHPDTVRARENFLRWQTELEGEQDDG